MVAYLPVGDPLGGLVIRRLARKAGDPLYEEEAGVVRIVLHDASHCSLRGLRGRRVEYPHFHLKLYAPNKFVSAIQDPHTNIKSKWGPN